MRGVLYVPAPVDRCGEMDGCAVFVMSDDARTIVQREGETVLDALRRTVHEYFADHTVRPRILLTHRQMRDMRVELIESGLVTHCIQGYTSDCTRGVHTLVLDGSRHVCVDCKAEFDPR